MSPKRRLPKSAAARRTSSRGRGTRPRAPVAISTRLSRALPDRKFPAGPDEVTGVAAGMALEIVLMLGFRFPEIAGGRHFGHDLAGPESGRLDIGDRLLGDPLLLGRRIENRRAIARAGVVALAVRRRRVMDLEEEFQELPIADLRGIEDDLDAFGMRPVMAIGRVAHIAAGIADPRRDDAVIAADQILHAPEAAPGKNRAFLGHRTSSTWSR